MREINTHAADPEWRKWLGRSLDPLLIVLANIIKLLDWLYYAKKHVSLVDQPSLPCLVLANSSSLVLTIE